jgi:FkbM family methyltransferase
MAHDLGTATEVMLKLPHGDLASLVGDPADTSVIGPLAASGGEHACSPMALLPSLVAHDSVCVDVGANVGAITLALSRLCPDGHVHAFEPARESFQFLELNRLRNRAANVTAHRLALSDTIGEEMLSYNRGFTGGAFISDYLRDGVEQAVKVSTLDAWAETVGLRRLDLVKIDVEGCEARVLDGGRATIARFRPTLIVELNPVTMRRMQHRPPHELFQRLRSVYGAIGHLAVIPETGPPLLPVFSWRQMRRALARSGICDIVCSPDLLLPGLHPGVAGPRTAAAAFLRGARHYSRFSIPPWAAVVEPHVTISLGGELGNGARPLNAPPGSERLLSLLIKNLGDVAIVGEAPRFPVSLRVIWIDDEEHHRVDDRSRIAAPTLRPGAFGAAQLPLLLPDKPGRYVARITLFQEQVAWFHDLDAASCLDLSVLVSA